MYLMLLNHFVSLKNLFLWKPLNLEIVRSIMFHDQVIEKGSYCNIITSMKDMATGKV